MMTIREAVKWGAKRLRDNNVDNADHDSFELLSAINGMTRTFYLVNGDSMLSEENFLLYEEYIDKRAAHVPLQHILGKAYFYGYEFDCVKYTQLYYFGCFAERRTSFVKSRRC